MKRRRVINHSEWFPARAAESSRTFHAKSVSQPGEGVSTAKWGGAHVNALKTPQTRRSRSVAIIGATRESVSLGCLYWRWTWRRHGDRGDDMAALVDLVGMQTPPAATAKCRQPFARGHEKVPAGGQQEVPTPRLT